jgi:hypothetical protein
MAEFDLRSASRPSRETLSSNRTFFIRSDGSDGNSGSHDSPEAAFRTWQHACRVASKFDFGGNVVTIQHGAERGVKQFAAGCTITGLTGGGLLRLRGNGKSTIIGTTDNCITAQQVGGTIVQIENLQLTSANATCLRAAYMSLVTIGENVAFGAAGMYHIWVHDNQACVQMLNVSCEINGSARSHLFIQNGGHVFVESCTINLVGSPHFSEGYVQPYMRGSLQYVENNVIGSATGSRFNANYLSIINLHGERETVLPGDRPGTLANGSYANCVLA